MLKGETGWMSRHNALYLAVFLLMIWQMGSGLHWAYMDVMIRLFPDSAYAFPPNVVEFVHNVAWWQEAMFFLAVIFTVTSLVLMIARHKWVLISFGLSILFSKSDWIAAGFAGFDSAGYNSMVREMIVLIGLLFLNQMDVFKRGRLPF